MNEISSLYKFLKNKKVLITGHTGLKRKLANIVANKNRLQYCGISKDIPSKPSNFYNFAFRKKNQKLFF